MSGLRRARTYFANDGDGCFDEMDEYSSDGKFYYADDVDAEVGRLKKRNEELRKALEYIANAEGDFDGNVDGNGLRQIAIDALKNSPGV